MTQTKRFFVALLPPQDVQVAVNAIKQDFADRYASRAAQKSPPHITLQPPFEWKLSDLPALEQQVSEFGSNYLPLPIVLDGFAAFPPRVIFINVHKTVELLAVQTDLMNLLEENLGIVDPVSKSRPFAPHMTVAFHDLTKQNFHLAWAEFQARSLHFEFFVSQLTLLIHEGDRWHVYREFPFPNL